MILSTETEALGTAEGLAEFANALGRHSAEVFRKTFGDFPKDDTKGSDCAFVAWQIDYNVLASQGVDIEHASAALYKAWQDGYFT